MADEGVMYSSIARIVVTGIAIVFWGRPTEGRAEVTVLLCTPLPEFTGANLKSHTMDIDFERKTVVIRYSEAIQGPFPVRVMRER